LWKGCLCLRIGKHAKKHIAFALAGGEGVEKYYNYIWTSKGKSSDLPMGTAKEE